MAQLEKKKEKLDLIIDLKTKALDQKSLADLNQILGKPVKIHDFESVKATKFRLSFQFIKPNSFGTPVSMPPLRIGFDPKIMQFLPGQVHPVVKKIKGNNFVLKNISINQGSEFVFDVDAIPSANGSVTGRQGGHGPIFKRRT